MNSMSKINESGEEYCKKQKTNHMFSFETYRFPSLPEPIVRELQEDLRNCRRGGLIVLAIFFIFIWPLI